MAALKDKGVDEVSIIGRVVPEERYRIRVIE